MSVFTDQVESFKARQTELARRCIVAPIRKLPRYVAGADCAFSSDKKSIFAVALVWDRIENRTIEVSRVQRAVTIPYVPGFLSFREGPALHAAIAQLKTPFGAILFDGQGRAHPRRCGLATHLGVELDVISVGAAKSLFIGEYDEPASSADSQSPLMDNGEQVGVVLRTRENVKPMFISIGHRADLKSSAKLILACCTKFRMPEPTRLADIEVGQYKKFHHGEPGEPRRHDVTKTDAKKNMKAH